MRLPEREVLCGDALGRSSCSVSLDRTSRAKVEGEPKETMNNLLIHVASGDAAGSIRTYRMDPSDAALQLASTALAGSSTSFLAWHPSRRFLYAAQNRADRLTSFAVVPRTGALARLNDVPIEAKVGSETAGPAYLTVDRSGTYLLAANYRGHTVVVHTLGPDGSIGPMVHSVSDGRHAHLVRLDASNRFAFVPYLGTDAIAQYRFDAKTGRLSPNDPALVATTPGAGPRHLDEHPNGHWVYVVNELDATVTAYDYEPRTGILSPFQTLSALPDDYTGRRWAADIHVAPGGQFLYASNRAHDSIAVFAIDPHDGHLAAVACEDAHGRTPRSFAIDPEGRWLLVAHQDSGTIVAFDLDAASGRLHRPRVVAECEAPYFVGIVAAP
jgi:6-phosphogluconolactonase